MSEALVLAYLTSRYARASDSFVRAEVLELRRLGHTVHTFSVRRPTEEERVGEAVEAEFRATDYVLARGARRLARAAAGQLVRRPRHLARTVLLAARLGAPGVRGRLWPFAYLAEACYLAERLESLGVQHLHVHIAEGAASVAALVSQLSGVPFSVTVHGPGEFDRPEALRFDLKLARATFFVAISDFARSQICRWADPADWDKIHIVRCGVDRALLDRSPVALPDAPTLVSIGRLDPPKGQLVLLEALSLVASEGAEARIVLVGDGPLRKPLQDAAVRLGVAERVRFAGWLTNGEVVRAIEQSRALVMASLAEGLPVAVMESLALGRPVIATSVAALAELVVPGENGWLVPAGSAEALALAVREALLTTDGELERMGRAGRERVRERHGTAREVRKLEALFRCSVVGDEPQ